MRAFRIALIAAIALFVMLAAWKAMNTPFALDDFPEELAIKVELLPLIFPLHMVTGGLALLLVPLTFVARRHPRWHRPLGRITAADVLISGLTAFPVALVAPVTRISALGFSAQAAVWLTLLALGIHNIRRGRVAAHRACMLLMAATTSGALLFRIALAWWAILGSARHYEVFYAADAWLAWSLPLSLAAYLLHRGSLGNETGSLRAIPR
ncbi:MAG: DUF2306 domain-containing protein [Novosphingobium sp.]|nr:DUF2306 domain-containing protein [Novosphingobium sp.]